MTNLRCVRMLAICASMFTFSCAHAAHAALVLNTVGGGPFPVNLSLAGTAFAKDVIGGGLPPTHTIANVNNGTYGNGSSWIGDSLNSFVGISYGAVPISIGSVAWGRDNTGVGYADRTAGVYTLEYTTDPNPSELTPNASWTSLGSVVYQTQGTLGNPNSASLRHEWSFTPVLATGIRLTAPGSSFADGAAIDELESTALAPAALALVATGGSFGPGNLAPAGTAFAKDLLGGGAYAPTHTIPNVNNGTYGNGSSWIGDSADSFVGVALPSLSVINQIAFGRDNAVGFGDRATGIYLIQYTTAGTVDALTPDSSWTTLGGVYYDPADGAAALRHLYEFAPVAATGVRIFAPGNGIASGAAIDEIEIYNIPEPSTLLLGFIGLVGLALLRRGQVA